MPIVPPKPLSIRSANPADFPCDAGRAPDVGFSTPNSNGKPASISLSFSGSNITDAAKINTFANLLGACENKTNAGDLGYAMNCAPNAGVVQNCNTLYNCTAPSAKNGTLLGSAQTNSVSAHLSVFAGDLSSPALPCYASKLQGALANATSNFPASEQSAAKSGASSLKFGKVGVMAVAASAAIMVLSHAV